MNNSGIPIFLINMEQSSERLKDVKEQLDALDLSFQRIDATVGSQLSTTEIASVYDAQTNKKLHHRNLTVGEIGCYVSHRKAWQALLDSNAKFGLILEDDISINNNLPNCLQLISRSSGWDILKISDTENVTPAQTKKIDDEFNVVSYKKVPNRTMAYLLTAEAASKLLSLKRFYRPVDVDVQCYDDFNLSVCGLRPNAVEMSLEFGLPEKSDIAQTNKGRHSSRSTFLRNLKYRWAMHRRRQHISFDVNNFNFD